MSISLRRMTGADIPLGMALKDQAGWNQTPADWRRFLALEPDGCFVAMWDGRPVATTTTCVFGPVAWIAMVLVDQAYRHRGIATRLVQHALEYLDGRGVATVRLDATSLGQPVYEQLGFAVEHHVVRWQGVAGSGRRVARAYSVRNEDLEQIVALDRSATGTDRRRLIERLVSERPWPTCVAHLAGSVVGYALLRSGARAVQIGPAVAASKAAGREVCDAAWAQCSDQAVFIDVPLENEPAARWAQSRGLTEQRRFARMFRGPAVHENPRLLWASSGPEKG
jgi:GNAT superfamily N-acetyltransferase